MKREEDSHPVTLVVTTRFLVYCLHLCANKLDLDRSLEMYAFVGKYFAVLLSLNLLPINQHIINRLRRTRRETSRSDPGGSRPGGGTARANNFEENPALNYLSVSFSLDLTFSDP